MFKLAYKARDLHKSRAIFECIREMPYKAAILGAAPHGMSLTVSPLGQAVRGIVVLTSVSPPPFGPGGLQLLLCKELRALNAQNRREAVSFEYSVRQHSADLPSGRCCAAGHNIQFCFLTAY